MPSNPRPALKTIIKTARLARQYLQIVEAGHDLSDFPLVEPALLVWLRDTAEAVHNLTPPVRAMQPKAPWLKLALFEGVDPLRPERFFASYPDGVIAEVIRKDVLPLGRAATRILAEIEERGLPVSSTAPPAAYQFKVSLVGLTPPIWRRLVISNQATLHKLHMAIQVMGGWWNYHLHLFEIAGTEYGDPDPDGELHHLSSARYKLNALPLTPGLPFRYVYDFGDYWELKVLLEDVIALDQAPPHPVCLGGERAFPHEDCGGVDGYRELVKILRRPRHPEYRQMREWAGPHYDPDVFDLDFVNRQLRTGRHLARL